MRRRVARHHSDAESAIGKQLPAKAPAIGKVERCPKCLRDCRRTSACEVCFSGHGQRVLPDDRASASDKLADFCVLWPRGIGYWTW